MQDKKKEFGLRVKKQENFSEWFSQVCSPTGAELADIRYGIGGLIVLLPNALRIARKIYEYLECEIEKDGHEPFLFPTLIREKYLTLEKEHAGFTPEVFWVERAGDKLLEERLALRPTGESQIYPMYSLWIQTYKQLPFKRYQSRHTVFRNEMSSRPFLRGREFLFFETHNCYSTEAEVMEQIIKDMNIMRDVIWDKLKIPHLFFKRPQWDKFKGAKDTYVADTIMSDGKRNQISSTHNLGTNFSQAFNIQFLDANGESRYVYQSCFGPGIWRIMAALIGIHGDDYGLVLPYTIAPIQVVIVPILFAKGQQDKSKAVLDGCKEIKRVLETKGYRVLIDDTDKSPGFKFNEWELKGVPLRIEIGPRDVEHRSVTVKRRTGGEKKLISEAILPDAVDELLEQVNQEIEIKAKDYFSSKIHYAEDIDAAIHFLDNEGGFVKVPFVSIQDDGQPYAELLQEKTRGAYVCGVLFPNSEIPEKGQECIISGKQAKELVYIARTH